MNRRKLIKYGVLGTASFVVNLGLPNPKKADAFLFLLLGNLLFNFASEAFLSGTFALLSGALRRRREEWFKRRREVMLAQRELIKREFTDVYAVEVESPQYNVILAASSIERLGYNVAFSFPHIIDSQPITSNFAGPASIGMAVAAKYLKENRKMPPQQIQRLILPRQSGGLYTYDSWKNWDSSSSTAYSSEYSDSGVRVNYEAVEPRPGGYGLIDVSVDVGRQIRIPQIRVQYPRT